MAEASLIWMFEAGVFQRGDVLQDAVARAGNVVLEWSDDSTEKLFRVSDSPIVFHGSLDVAAWIKKNLSWAPGAYCDVDALRFSSWAPRLSKWLLNDTWEVMHASDLVQDASRVPFDSVFVRPDNALKSFSGRVLKRHQLTLSNLDHGYYYEDEDLLVVVAPSKPIAREWRYVVVGTDVVAGSAYDPSTHAATEDDASGGPWKFAAEVARSVAPPEPVYVLDVCESAGNLYVVELNAFSGADLYACDGRAVADAITSVALRKDA